MSAEDLGPLPEPTAYITRESLGRLVDGGNSSRGTVPIHKELSGVAIHGVFTSSQLEAERQRCYELGAAQERERCAELVEYAQHAANWNQREALAKMIREGKRVVDRSRGLVA